MTPGTVDWLPEIADTDTPRNSGLRERKKRLLRQQLSDTATEMFVERGFDNVRITEIAEACGVSEKTVYNYFPTKESLILDRWQSTPTALLRALADPAMAPVDAALSVLDGELTRWTAWFAGRSDPIEASARVCRFVDLVRATPSLRAHEHDVTDQLIEDAARVLAARIGMGPDDPEPRIAAGALLELWRVQGRSLRRCLNGTSNSVQIHRLVSRDVQRAARILTDGLAGFDALRRRKPTRHRSVQSAPSATP